MSKNPWVSALNELLENPQAVVFCPACEVYTLKAIHVPIGDTGREEVHLFCKVCNANESALLPPAEDGSDHIVDDRPAWGKALHFLIAMPLLPVTYLAGQALLLIKKFEGRND